MIISCCNIYDIFYGIFSFFRYPKLKIVIAVKSSHFKKNSNSLFSYYCTSYQLPCAFFLAMVCDASPSFLPSRPLPLTFSNQSA